MKEALLCLALNIFFESANQSFLGQLAVGQTVLNRVASEKFPETVCEVVKEGPLHPSSKLPVKHKCQFSWWCDRKSDTPDDKIAWNIAKGIAFDLMNGHFKNYMDNILWYHSTNVNPEWRKKKRRVFRIDDHIFYSEN